MKFVQICLLSACLLSLCCACEKDLDIRYHDIEPLIVIEGNLGPEGVRVGLTYTTPMDEAMNLSRLTDAEVVVSDLTSGQQFSLNADEAGYFHGDEPGRVGHEYALSVARDGKEFEARCVMTPPVEYVRLLFNWIKMPYDHVAVLQGQFPDVSPDEDYYWVRICRNGEIYKWVCISDSRAPGSLVTFSVMTTRMDTDEEDEGDVLYDGDEMSVCVSAISRAMFEYLEALENDSSGPAMFTGDRCLGYFMASSPTRATIVFHPDEIEYYQ